MSTYQPIQFITIVKVKLNNKLTGEIREVDHGWCYFPKGKTQGGEVFSNLNDCKISLGLGYK